MSILPPSSFLHAFVLLAGLTMGVTNARQAHSWGRLQPIGGVEMRTICASLCLAGLGGEPCGAPCALLTPSNSSQFSGGNATAGTLAGRGGKTRRDACPLLCKYRLGDPLCHCVDERHISAGGGSKPQKEEVDYHRICSYFCSEHDYHIFGCPDCGVYKMQSLDRRVRPTEMDIDWEEWCREQCAVGMGGAACDCDLPLPLTMIMTANLTAQDAD